MQKYFFKKYNALKRYNADDITKVSRSSSYNYYNRVTVYLYYKIDTVSGFDVYNKYQSDNFGVTAYEWINAEKLEIYHAYCDGQYGVQYVYWTGTWTLNPYYIAGTLVGEVIALGDALPENGYNAADGYYYVRDRLVTEFNCMAGGAWKTAVPYVLTGGVWTQREYSVFKDGAWS